VTQAIARQRGRPFYLAVRVAGSLEMCRHLGYDLPTWIDEGLVDLLIPAGGASTDPAIEVEGFAALCRGTGVCVYPGFDGGLPDPHVGPEDAHTRDRRRTRAIAARHHRAGADGIYVFNWHADRDSRRDLLTCVGSPETLRGTDKIYAATHRFLHRQGAWRGAYDNDRVWGEVPVALLRTLTGDGPTVVLETAEDFEAASPSTVELRLRLDQWVRGDEVRAWWDGAALGEPEVRYCAAADPQHLSEVSSAAWLCWALDTCRAGAGAHAVKVVLVARHPKVASDLVLTNVELVVIYPA
jgi:hypothetical protein